MSTIVNSNDFLLINDKLEYLKQQPSDSILIHIAEPDGYRNEKEKFIIFLTNCDFEIVRLMVTKRIHIMSTYYEKCAQFVLKHPTPETNILIFLITESPYDLEQIDELVNIYIERGHMFDKYEEVFMICHVALKMRSQDDCKMLTKMKNYYDLCGVDFYNIPQRSIYQSNFISIIIRMRSQITTTWLFAELYDKIKDVDLFQLEYNGSDIPNDPYFKFLIDIHIQYKKPLYSGFSIISKLVKQFEWKYVKEIIELFKLHGFTKEIFELTENSCANFLSSVAKTYCVGRFKTIDSKSVYIEPKLANWVEALKIAEACNELDTLNILVGGCRSERMSTASHVIAYGSLEAIKQMCAMYDNIQNTDCKYYFGCECCYNGENHDHSFRIYDTNYILKSRFGLEFDDLSKIQYLDEEMEQFSESYEDSPENTMEKCEKKTIISIGHIASTIKRLLDDHDIELNKDILYKYLDELPISRDYIQKVKSKLTH